MRYSSDDQLAWGSVSSHSQVPRCATPCVSTISCSLRSSRDSDRFSSVTSDERQRYPAAAALDGGRASCGAGASGDSVEVNQRRTPAGPRTPHWNLTAGPPATPPASQAAHLARASSGPPTATSPHPTRASHPPPLPPPPPHRAPPRAPPQ